MLELGLAMEKVLVIKYYARGICLFESRGAVHTQSTIAGNHTGLNVVLYCPLGFSSDIDRNINVPVILSLIVQRMLLFNRQCNADHYA